MADYTTVGLLLSARRRASIPSTSTTGSADSDLLGYANDELRLQLTAEILKLREGYFRRAYDHTISSSTTAYRMPVRAIGGKLEAVQLLDSAGAVLEAALPEIPPSRLDEFDSTGSTAAYYVRGNEVVLIPSASTTAVTLRMLYFAQPNELVASGYAVITAINTSTKTLTMASTSGLTSAALDFVSATPGFESLAIDQTPSGSTGTTLTFSTTLPTALATGDYVVLAKKSPVPQIPSEYHPILAQRMAICYLEAGDRAGVDKAVAKLKAMEEAIGILSSPRVDMPGRKTVPRFSFFFGRGRR